jgi:hypothetical protein
MVEYQNGDKSFGDVAEALIDNERREDSSEK